MIQERNDLLEWNQDFVTNNSDLNLEDSIYKTFNDNVFIFRAHNIPRGYKQNMYQFIIDGLILENADDGGVCYFCEFIFFRGGKIKSLHKEHGLCEDCIILWNISINLVKKLNNELFIVDDTRTNRITVNAINNRDNVIIYEKIIIAKDRFSYTHISKFIIDGDCCDRCYLGCNYEDNNMCFKGEIFSCNKCLNYSKQLLIDEHYPKYMNIVRGAILDDSSTVIINYLVSLLIL